MTRPPKLAQRTQTPVMRLIAIRSSLRLTMAPKKTAWGRMMFFEERLHEGVTAVFDEVADVAGHAVLDELGAGEFVLGEDEEEEANGDAQEGFSSCLLVGRAHFFFCWAMWAARTSVAVKTERKGAPFEAASSWRGHLVRGRRGRGLRRRRSCRLRGRLLWR